MTEQEIRTKAARMAEQIIDESMSRIDASYCNHIIDDLIGNEFRVRALVMVLVGMDKLKWNAFDGNEEVIKEVHFIKSAVDLAMQYCLRVIKKENEK